MRRTYHIRNYVAWLTLVPLLVMAVSMAFFFLHDRFRSLDQDLVVRGNLIAHQLASSSEYGVYANNREFLQNIAQGVLQQDDVSAVMILNEHAAPLVALRKDVPSTRKNADPVGLLTSADLTRLDFSKNSQVRQGASGYLQIYQAINATQVVLDDLETKAPPKQVGTVVVEMSWARTHALKLQLLWFAVLATVMFLVVAFYLVYLSSRRIAMPVGKLSAAIREIGSGNLNVRVNIDTKINELATLARGINDMAAQLQHERAILQQRIDDATLQLRSLAFYDTLTQLPNRRMLEDRLAQAISVSNRTGKYGAIMFIDLDNFKPLNDRYGHACGDLLLMEAARRITGCLRAIDTVARFGGDEFVILIGQLSTDPIVSAEEVALIADKVRVTLARVYVLREARSGQADVIVEHQCTSSIGISLFLDDELSRDDILTRADKAMYQAKDQGRNQVCFYQEP
ncbi:MAG: diguanylate cyclase [Sulfuriferula sp.]